MIPRGRFYSRMLDTKGHKVHLAVTRIECGTDRAQLAEQRRTLSGATPFVASIQVIPSMRLCSRMHAHAFPSRCPWLLLARRLSPLMIRVNVNGRNAAGPRARAVSPPNVCLRSKNHSISIIIEQGGGLRSARNARCRITERKQIASRSVD